ncbi:MAG: hypothetical protein HOV81_14785 [Kofleriaceae bacterium]|nr:hypothetical protein [Kofleriaceae bacterium]
MRIAILLIVLVAAATAHAEPAPDAPTCDAVALEKDANRLVKRGHSLAAFEALDKLARCKPTAKNYWRLGVSACEMWNRSKHPRFKLAVRRAVRGTDDTGRRLIQRACRSRDDDCPECLLE